ncbi:hypothetical protein NX059_006506 [Plenodomus lindquistii]|nr:hypothetical protein NX059_006506 [Plenodomus lindquistii]
MTREQTDIDPPSILPSSSHILAPRPHRYICRAPLQSFAKGGPFPLQEMDHPTSSGSRRDQQPTASANSNSRRRPALPDFDVQTQPESSADQSFAPIDNVPHTRTNKRQRADDGDMVAEGSGHDSATEEQESVIALKNDVAALKVENADLRRQYDQLGRDHKAYAHDTGLKLLKKKDEVDNLRTKRHAMNQQYHDLQRKTLDHHEQLHAKDQALDDAKKDNLRLTGEVIRVEEESHAKDRLLDELQRKLLDMRTQVLQCNEEVICAQKMAHAKVCDNQKLKQQNGILQHELHVAKDRIAYYQKQREATLRPESIAYAPRDYPHSDAPRKNIKPSAEMPIGHGKLWPGKYGSNGNWDLGLCHYHFNTANRCKNRDCLFRHSSLTHEERQYIETLGNEGRAFLAKSDASLRRKGDGL